jgi:hypothetical protein
MSIKLKTTSISVTYLKTAILIGLGAVSIAFFAKWFPSSKHNEAVLSPSQPILVQSSSQLTVIPPHLFSALLLPTIEIPLPPSANESLFISALAERINGEPEVTIDGGRVDIVTERYAIEVDFLRKWKEGIGQSQFYSNKTHKLPALFLIHDRGQIDSRVLKLAADEAQRLGIHLISVVATQ